jgi:hypothetical protein
MYEKKNKTRCVIQKVPQLGFSWHSVRLASVVCGDQVCRKEYLCLSLSLTGEIEREGDRVVFWTDFCLDVLGFESDSLSQSCTAYKGWYIWPSKKKNGWYIECHYISPVYFRPTWLLLFILNLFKNVDVFVIC